MENSRILWYTYIVRGGVNLELINISDVSKRYKNGVTAIYDLDLKIKKGEFVFVIGGSGSWKSTLIKMLYREEKPTKGQIIIGGINVAKLRNSKVYKLRRRLGIVFQDYRLLPKLTVYENVAFTLEVIGTKKSEIKKRTLKAIELVGLKAKTRNYPNQLWNFKHLAQNIDLIRNGEIAVCKH